MEITDINQFLRYLSRIRQRTERVIKAIPQEFMDWKPAEDALSFVDVIRHIGAIEFDMYLPTIQGLPSRYQGHDPSITRTDESALSYLRRVHETFIGQLSRINDLNAKCKTPASIEITKWKWLRAMIEHEVHHRGQLYTYLRILGVSTPPLYSLTSEQVVELSNNQDNQSKE